MHKLASDSLVGVSETLLIPLHYRVVSSRKATGSYKDAMAERFHDSIDYDWGRFQGHGLHVPGIAARTEILDDQVKAFMSRYGNGRVINLGCGLDTRFYRLDNGIIDWIEVDLPDVIAFRKGLSEPQSPRHRLVAGSVLEEDWIDEIGPSDSRAVLLIAEGLLPYFTEEQHKHIFGYLARRFPGQQMLFHTSAPFIRGFVQSSDLPKLKTTAAPAWGLEDSAQIETLEPRAHLLGEFPLLAGRESEFPPEIRQRLTAEQLRKAAKIVHVRFE